VRRITRVKAKLIATFPLLEKVQRYLYRLKPYRSKFRAYYLNGGWSDAETVSGPGSTLESTRTVRQQIPKIFSDFNIRSVVDIPCGDFYWMREIDLRGVDYQGFDIVRELIDSNNAKYRTATIRFGCRDLIKDNLPVADLVICRDCLIHYTTRYVIKAIHNIKRSGSTYLLTTTFTSIAENREIESTGLFTPINLQRPPYGLPRPILLIDDGGKDGRSLGLWRLSEIQIDSFP
jgi:hypothetical protein